MICYRTQECIIERRRQQQRSDGDNRSSCELVQTVSDLAYRLRAFASDAVVVKHLIDFALPSKKRALAAEVTAKGASVSAGSRSARQADATEQTSKPKKQLKQHDDGRQKDSCDVVLSRQTAKAMADSFFKFVVQEHLQQHLSRMSAGQILVLCIFHSRLSWQKGKPL